MLCMTEKNGFIARGNPLVCLLRDRGGTEHPENGASAAGHPGSLCSLRSQQRAGFGAGGADEGARRAAGVIPAVCEPDIDREFMLEYRNFLLRHAVERLKRLVSSETFMIFEMLEIDERPVAEVALLTNRSANALYVTRHRCLKKLREIIDAMQTELETPPETASPAEPRTAPRS